jgi:hypothetical protein
MSCSNKAELITDQKWLLSQTSHETKSQGVEEKEEVQCFKHRSDVVTVRVKLPDHRLIASTDISSRVLKFWVFPERIGKNTKGA